MQFTEMIAFEGMSASSEGLELDTRQLVELCWTKREKDAGGC